MTRRAVRFKAEAVRITADRVGKWFGEVIAVNNCTLSVGRGVIGLLGANGAGKIDPVQDAGGPDRAQPRRRAGLRPRLRHEVGLVPPRGLLPRERRPARVDDRTRVPVADAAADGLRRRRDRPQGRRAG